MPVPKPPMTPYVKYSAQMFVTYDDSTQLSPDSAQPIEISRRGPKRSTSHAWIGEQNVCSTIKSENVTCNCASVAPSLPSRGWTNNVHVYCGLEIDIIATNPSNICHQRVASDADGCAAFGNAVLIASPPWRVNGRTAPGFVSYCDGLCACGVAAANAAHGHAAAACAPAPVSGARPRAAASSAVDGRGRRRGCGGRGTRGRPATARAPRLPRSACARA